jgi:negative regulator of genetic competence, sporulation and motility
MAWLQGLTAVDLGISFENQRDFAATQEMTEEMRQEVAYQGAFGTDGPVLRRVRTADEGTLSFSVILLKSGIQNHMNNEDVLRTMRDFDVQTSRGNHIKTYRGCNWNRISIRSTLDQVTLDCDISVPGYAAPIQ